MSSIIRFLAILACLFFVTYIMGHIIMIAPWVGWIFLGLLALIMVNWVFWEFQAPTHYWDQVGIMIGTTLLITLFIMYAINGTPLMMALHTLLLSIWTTAWVHIYLIGEDT